MKEQHSLSTPHSSDIVLKLNGHSHHRHHSSLNYDTAAAVVGDERQSFLSVSNAMMPTLLTTATVPDTIITEYHNSSGGGGGGGGIGGGGNSAASTAGSAMAKGISNDSINLTPKVSNCRQSCTSKVSIGAFLANFPTSEVRYADREIINTMAEMIKSDIGISSQMSLVAKLRLILKSNKFNMFIILLVILDCVSVVVHIVIDVIHKDFHNAALHFIEMCIEFFGIFILSLFGLIIVANMVLLPRTFFASKLELIDAVLVMVAFVSELVSLLKNENVKEIEALVIIFRFWRIIRIVMAIVITVEKRVYEKLKNLKIDVKNIMDENSKQEVELVKRQSQLDAMRIELAQKCSELETRRHDIAAMQLKMKLLQNENTLLRKAPASALSP